MRQASYVAEGILDKVVLTRMIAYTKILPTNTQLYGGSDNTEPLTLPVRGKLHTLKQRAGHPLVLEVAEIANQEARHKRWIALTDLDNKFPQLWRGNIGYPTSHPIFAFALQCRR